MKIEDHGIVISAYKFGDSSLIIKLLSENHGPVKGLIRGQQRNANIIQAGNLVHFTWSARLDDQLGMITATLEKAYPLLYFSEFQKILSISSMTAFIDALIPEREHSNDIFNRCNQYMETLSSPQWLENYVRLELFMLEKTGFGMDMERCSVSGSVDNITYISPKTGAAVSLSVGEPYKARLFSIPSFFKYPLENTENLRPSMQEIIDGLEITRYFFTKHFFGEGMAKLPNSCQQFHNEILKSSSDQARQNRDYKF